MSLNSSANKPRAMTQLLNSLFDELRPSLTQLVKEAVQSAIGEQKPTYPEFVNVYVASEITGYSKNSLYQMHSRGQVPGACKVGGKLVFDTATLREWVNQGRKVA